MNLSFMEFVIVNIVLYNIVVFVEFSVFMVCFLVVLFIDKVWIWFIWMFKFMVIIKLREMYMKFM